MPRLALLLAAFAVLSWPASAGAVPWRRPVPGAVVGRFAYWPARPFSAGQRRGADFAAAAGARVLAPCTGRVRFAGPVPGRGLGVSLGCGRLTATVLGLGALAVRRGALALAGVPVGRAAGSGPVRLGARVSGRRFAYLDPLRLIGPGPPSGPRPLVPWRGPRRGRPAPPAVARRPAAPVAGPRAAPTGAPLASWLGATLLAVGLTAGLGLPRWRRRRAASDPAPARR